VNRHCLGIFVQIVYILNKKLRAIEMKYVRLSLSSWQILYR